jgi:hypothetical protein
MPKYQPYQNPIQMMNWIIFSDSINNSISFEVGFPHSVLVSKRKPECFNASIIYTLLGKGFKGF